MKDKYCELCEAKGLKRKLKFCCVNFDEGIFLCENDMCVYPFGAAVVDSLLFKTSAAEIVSEKPGRKGLPKSTEQTTRTSSASNTPASNFYWTNSDNLCWLDSVMTTLVNNRCLRLCLEKYRPKNSILQQLCTNFNEAQELGPTEQGRGMLLNVRVKVFEFLKTKMQCSLGVNDSALESLNALLKDSSVIRERFIQECEWTFRCSLCGYSQVDRHNKLVVTFPNTTDDFSMPSGVFQRACYKCKATAQRSQLELKRFPPCVMAHFVEGVKNKDFFKSGFVCQGNNYELCQLIQYKRNPHHFIAWVRNCNGTHWAKVDDTENAVCSWTKGIPSFPLDQVYIAVWERAKLYQRKFSVENAARSSSEAKKPACQRKITKSIPAIPKGLAENLNESKSKLISTRDQRLHEPFSTREKLAGKHQNGGKNVAEASNERNDQHSLSCNSTKTMEVSAEAVASKRKSDTFEPYIPKKNRALTSSFSLDEGKSKVCPEDFTSPAQPAEDKARTNFLQWKGRNVPEKQNQGIVHDNQSDSGYSSPGSNGSCVSLPGHCSKEENSILRELVDTLDEIDELARSRSCDNTQKVDSFHLKPFEGGPRTIPTSLDSSLSCSQSKTQITGHPKVELSDYMMDLNWCGYSSNKDVSCGKACDKINDFDLSKNLDASCDFPDIDTLSNCGNDLIEELDSIIFVPTGKLSDGLTKQEIDMNDVVQLSTTIESPMPNSKDIIDILGTQEPVKSSKCDADNHTNYIRQNNDVLGDLKKTMKSIIYSSEYQAKLKNLTKSENSTSSVQNTLPFLDKTKVLKCPVESVNPPDSDSFPEDRKDRYNDISVESIPVNQKTSYLSLNEESCDFPSLDLPDITEFVQLQGSFKNDSSTSSADQNSSIQDILEQIFPSKLLDKDSCEQSSTCERTDITEKNTGLILGASDVWTNID